MGELRQNALGTKKGLVAWCLRVNEHLPLLKYMGLALWIGWFGVAYSTPSWVSASASNVGVVSSMFTVSTAGHVAGLLLVVLLSCKFRDIVFRPWLVGAAGLLACAGCVVVVLSSPDFLFPDEAVFVAGCAATGLGTAAFAVYGGLLLCQLPPRKALSTLLICEIVAAAVQLMTLGLPHDLARVVFIALPLLSTCCFVLASLLPTPEAQRESSRLMPSGSFFRFLFVVFILALTSYVARGVYTHLATPVELSMDGAIVNLLVLVMCAALAVLLAGAKRLLRFVSWFYPMATAIVLLLLLVILFPGWITSGIVLSSVVFQLFDIVLWYAFAIVVYRAKVWATFVIAMGRIALSAGVTAGNVVGDYCFVIGGFNAPSPVLLILLFVALLVVFLFFPESQAMRMLVFIPDEDAEEGAGALELVDGVTEAESTEAVAVVGDGEALSEVDPNAAASGEQGRSAGRGRWRARVLRLADEAGLTEREKEVFLLLARGMGAQSISDQLVVSLYTTRAHTRNIYTKLDVHSRQELIDKANRYGRES